MVIELSNVGVVESSNRLIVACMVVWLSCQIVLDSNGGIVKSWNGGVVEWSNHLKACMVAQSVALIRQIV